MEWTPEDLIPITTSPGRTRSLPEDVVRFDDAHRRRRQVVVLRRHQPGVLGGLPADERTAGLHAAVRDAGNDRRDPLGVQLAARDVVLQEQRLGAAGDQVVDHHGDQVDTDGVVDVQRLRDRGLRADPVRRRREHRLPELVDRQLEQRGEATDSTHHLWSVGFLGVRLHPVDGLLAGGDGDP